jgi:hypothetical protein
VRDATLEKEQCQICNRATAESFYTISLYGRRYNSLKMWTDTVVEYKGYVVKHDDEEHVVCLSVGARSPLCSFWGRLCSFSLALFAQL